MDYSFTDEQKQIVEAARKFAVNEFPKVARKCDREEKFPMEILKKQLTLGSGEFLFLLNTADWGLDGRTLYHELIITTGDNISI